MDSPIVGVPEAQKPVTRKELLLDEMRGTVTSMHKLMTAHNQFRQGQPPSVEEEVLQTYYSTVMSVLQEGLRAEIVGELTMKLEAAVEVQNK